VDEIVVVDGRSVDGTIAVARQLWPDATIVSQTRRGKGNALACGFSAASGDIIVMLDADGSTDPAEIPAYVAALTAGADFAKGSRFCPGGGSCDITRIRRLGNRVLNGIVNLLYGTRYTDLCYGYNAFWSRCLPVLALEPGDPGPRMRWGDGFEVETVINVRIADAGLAVTEVPSFEEKRIHGVSKLNAVSDGMRVLRTIAREYRHLQRRGSAASERPHSDSAGSRMLSGDAG
jgi:glycosyltransferase involved in cell wall biosynthesis